MLHKILEIIVPVSFPRNYRYDRKSVARERERERERERGRERNNDNKDRVNA